MIAETFQKLKQKIPFKLPSLPIDKERWKTFWKKYYFLAVCLAAPMLIFYLIYLAREIHPFGNGSVLVLDLNGQYVWFFEALHNFSRGDASLLYSFSRQLGGEFLGIYAYYIASPLSYLVCLFPKTRMLEALLTLFLVKAGLCGFTFGYYLYKETKIQNRLAVIAFSICYSVTAYAVVQQHNTMWIDAVMWLPLITLGIEELIRHGKYKVYTVFLALTLFSNFYIGYMVCIYCFVYFFASYIAKSEQGANNPLGEKNHFFKTLGRIAFYSVIAVGISAVVLLGAYYALNFGKSTFSTPSWKWEVKTDFVEILYKMLPGSYDTVRPEGYPFIYCGLMTLLMIPAYFLSNKYTMREKVVYGVLSFFFLASFSFSVLDLIWHGFQTPNWLNFRYSFMFCFLLCIIACKALDDFENINLRVILGTAGFLGLFCLYLQKYTSGDYVKPNDLTCVWFTILALFIYLVVLAILRKTNQKQFVSVVLVCVMGFEAFVVGLFNMNDLDSDVGYSKYSYFNQFLTKTTPIVETVQEADTSFYRMEKTFARSTNDNMALNIRGLSGSSSTLNKETIMFLQKMGYSSKSHWSKYLGGTPVNDSLLGLKYIISDQSLYENYYEIFATDENNGYTAYLNPYALSIAYGVDEKTMEFPLGYTNLLDEDEDTEDESKVKGVVSAIKSKLNRLFEIDETQTDSDYVDMYDSPFERLNALVGYMLGQNVSAEIFQPISVDSTKTSGLSKGRVSLHTAYSKTSEESDGKLTYTITVPKTAEIYFYLPSDYPREVKLSMKTVKDDVTQTEFPGLASSFYGNETNRIISLGYFEAGTEISLSMEVTTKYFYVKDNCECFYYINQTAFEEAFTALAKDQLNVTDFSETKLLGTFTASAAEERVLTTLAFDKGWKVYVDGEQVETEKALGSLVSFKISGETEQTHTVKLVYRPNTYVIGMSATVFFLLLFICIVIFEKQIKKVPVLRALVSAFPPKEKDYVEEKDAIEKSEEAKNDTPPVPESTPDEGEN